jgi:hypothetical protein
VVKNYGVFTTTRGVSTEQKFKFKFKFKLWNLDTKFDKKKLRVWVWIDDFRIFHPSSYSGLSLICFKKGVEWLGRARIDDFWISTPLPFRSLGCKSRGRKSPRCRSLRRNYSSWCLYVHIRSRYLVRGGRLILGINSKVFMSIKPSISGRCASMNLFASTCRFICACVCIWGFCICMA